MRRFTKTLPPRAPAAEEAAATICPGHPFAQFSGVGTTYYRVVNTGEGDFDGGAELDFELQAWEGGVAVPYVPLPGMVWDIDVEAFLVDTTDVEITGSAPSWTITLPESIGGVADTLLIQINGYTADYEEQVVGALQLVILLSG